MEAPRFSDIPPGYPRHASLTSRDKVYAIFRRFSTLNSRNLFYLQSEILDLEAQLLRGDRELQQDANEIRRGFPALRSWKAFSQNKSRVRLFRRIRTKLKVYNTALLQCRDVLQLDTPSNEHVDLLQSWLNKEQPLDDEGKNYLADTEPRGEWERERFKFAREPRELASLDKKYDSLLARIVRKTPLGLFYLEDIIHFGPPNNRGTLWFFPSSKIDRLVSIVAVTLAVGLTFFSMLALYLETRDPVRLGLVAMFSSVAAVFLAMCGAKKSEVLIGTIGYAAVLVVFISATH